MFVWKKIIVKEILGFFFYHAILMFILCWLQLRETHPQINIHHLKKNIIVCPSQNWHLYVLSKSKDSSVYDGKLLS